MIERVDRYGRPRFRGMYTGVDGKVRSAGTFDSHERAIEVAQGEETHARGLLTDTPPAEKATKTIQEFGDERFLRYHHSSAGTRQTYGYTLKNHVYPYIGHLRISEINRETFYNLLLKVLPSEDGGEASPSTVRTTRKVLSSLCQMALDEEYRGNNPLRTIRLPQAPSKPVLVANHEQWNRFESTLSAFRPAQLYARVNVTTWARRCEMISFRPCDFDLDTGMVTIGRSTIYLNSRYHPSGKAGWLTKDNPKNGDSPYNARHTGISWAIAKGIDLQKVRQRAGHGSSGHQHRRARRAGPSGSPESSPSVEQTVRPTDTLRYTTLITQFGKITGAPRRTPTRS